MLRLIPGRLLLQLGFATLCFPALANGQIFARAALEVEGAENVACGLSACPPRVLTYGYYHEHWRRWPEDASGPLAADSLSPFARPDRNVPAVDLPEPREEDSMAPRRPRGRSGPPQGATGSPAASPPTAPQVAPPAPSGGRDIDQQPETLPERDLEPFEPSTPSPDNGGFFPPADPNDSGDLPDGLPQDGFGAPLPPADLDPGLPAEEFNEPAENNADDVFDLDDFSRVDPRRLQRYRMSARGQMRRPGATQSRPTPQAARGQRVPARLAAYRPTQGGRRNPLRTGGAAALPEEPTHIVEPAAWEFEPIATERSIEPPAETLQWTEPVDTVPAVSRRNNPLR